MKKIFSICLCLCSSLGLYAETDTWLKDFEFLEGKETKYWQNVTEEKDKGIIQRFKQLYEKNFPLAQNPHYQVRIPRTVHVIWLGPKGFPPQSVENMRMWMAKNPGWKFKFWIDRERPLPCAGMEKIIVNPSHFAKLGSFYERAPNWGEKSDLLRYEILFREGGLYIDHDSSCLQTFEDFHRAFDFYAGMQVPRDVIPCSEGSGLSVANGMIGCKAGHPILKNCIERICAKWNQLEDGSAMQWKLPDMEPTFARTYYPFTFAIYDEIDKYENIDIVLPAAFFYAQDTLKPLYSQQAFASTWIENPVKATPESELQKKATMKLAALEKSSKINKLVCLLIGVLALFSLGTALKLLNYKTKVS